MYQDNNLYTSETNCQAINTEIKEKVIHDGKEKNITKSQCLPSIADRRHSFCSMD